MGRLIAAFVVAAALSLPFTNVPVIDDWAYAYSVERLLQSGRFQILDYSCRYNLVQVLWGALFSLPAGFSFVAVRASTIALVIPGLLAFGDLLHRRTDDTALALWGTALLAFNPIFFRLSLSFMTDVPLVALVAISFWLFERGLRWSSTPLLVAGVATTVLGYLVRELALIACAALLAEALFSKRGQISMALVIALAAVAGIASALEFWWIGSVQGTTWGLSMRTGGLTYLLDVSPWLYAQALIHSLLTTAVFVAPLTLATVGDRRDWRMLIGGGIVIAALAVAFDAVPFGQNEVLSPLGLGMSRALLPGAAAITPLGQAFRALALTAGCASLVILLREVVFVCRRGWKERRELDTAWGVFGAGCVAALLVLWLWQDRYDLILLPSALWLAALGARRLGWQPRLAQAGIAAFAVLAVLGTRDDFDLNRAAWDAEESLRRSGVPASEIDAGYALNGWRLYAQTRMFAPGFPPERVPYLFSKDELPFVVSTRPVAGSEVVHEYTWPRTWLSESKLYALRR